MAAFSEADFKRSFDKILFGGQISPGIEVAADLGLESHKYIILPASLAIRTVWKYGPTEGEHKPELSQIDPCESQTDGVHTLPNGFKYVINPKAVYIRNQRYYCNNVDGLPTQGGESFQEVWPVFAQSPPMSALQQFIRHNIGRVGSTDYEDIVNGLGLRWYGTIFGLVYCVFDGEFEETTNTINTAVEREDDIIKGIMEPKRARECLTLICARFLSWRRTNHATGGPTATGVVQRTGSAFGWFDTTGSGANESLRRYTDLFHTNAHQSNCKVISSIFFGKHAEHWGVFCPKYGFTFPKEVQTSMRVRAENSSGVAGAAVITDAVAVLKNLILDQTFVCLQGTEAIPTLIDQYNHVKTNGLLCGVAQAWWVEHNPFGLTAQPLSEFTVTLQTLLGDIGAANDSYLNSKTLKNAKALESAYLKYGVSSRRDFWRQLGRVKKESGMKDIKTALSIMRKQVGIVGVECTSIIAENISVRNEAINKVNSIMTSVSTALGLPAPKTLVVPSAQEIAAAISEVNAAEHERAAPQGPQPMDLA